MPVKRFIRKIMKQSKNVKINPEIHTQLKIASAEEGVPVEIVASAAISLALEQRTKLRRLLEDHTKQEGTKAKE
jgi:hypothetical protein